MVGSGSPNQALLLLEFEMQVHAAAELLGHPRRRGHGLGLLVQLRAQGRQDGKGERLLRAIRHRIVRLRILRRGQRRAKGDLSYKN